MFNNVVHLRYTNAEQSYDWFGTQSEPTPFADERGNPFRRVTILDPYLDSQEARYGSGMRQSFTSEQFKEELRWGYAKELF